jgi:hypothetical protein
MASSSDMLKIAIVRTVVSVLWIWQLVEISPQPHGMSLYYALGVCAAVLSIADWVRFSFSRTMGKGFVGKLMGQLATDPRTTTAASLTLSTLGVGVAMGQSKGVGSKYHSVKPQLLAPQQVECRPFLV